MAIDPVCGMEVDESTGLRGERGGEVFYFCCDHCRKKFLKPPAEEMSVPQNAIYICPMHPEVRQQGPGDCPKCGMALEPLDATGEDAGNAELEDMTRRFVVSVLFGVAHLVPATASFGDSELSRWMQFLLATPVVCWCGFPFFLRGWRSVSSGHWNMFTLISLGVGSAFLMSAAAMLGPDFFPHSLRHGGKVPVYFESATVIVALVLLGLAASLTLRSAASRADEPLDPHRETDELGDLTVRVASGRELRAGSRRFVE